MFSSSDLGGISVFALQDELDASDFIVLPRPMELMQYTGLKDKNGVEIYEGDIYSDGFKLRHEYIVWNNRFASFTGRSKAYDNCVNLSEDFAARIEVIGNIYENKELLDVNTSQV